MPVAERRPAAVSGFAAAAEQYLAEDRLDAARDVCLQGVTQSPWYAPGHIVLAKIYRECGAHDAAEHSARRAIEIDPMNSVAHTLLGQVLLLQGNREEAAKALDEALFLCPADPVATELMRHAKEQEPAEPVPAPAPAPRVTRQPQPVTEEEEVSALRAMSGVDGVLVTTNDGLATAGTMGEGNENDEAVAASAATAIQTWKRSQALGTFGAPRWAAIVGEREQLVMADAGNRLVLTRMARRLRLGRVIPRVETACRNLSA